MRRAGLRRLSARTRAETETKTKASKRNSRNTNEGVGYAPSEIWKMGAQMKQVEAFTPAETGIAADELRRFIDRIENLEQQKAAFSDDIKDVFTELKGRGYDAKAVRQILKLRKIDPDERTEQEAIVELYLSALGMS